MEGRGFVVGCEISRIFKFDARPVGRVFLDIYRMKIYHWRWLGLRCKDSTYLAVYVYGYPWPQMIWR